MTFCPECGGEMSYISKTKRYACKSCGLSVTFQELIETRNRLKIEKPNDQFEERKKVRKEYLKWWLSKKK